MSKEYEKIRAEVAKSYKDKINEQAMYIQQLEKELLKAKELVLKERRRAAYYSHKYDVTPGLGAGLIGALNISKAFAETLEDSSEVKTEEDVLLSLKGNDLAEYLANMPCITAEDYLAFLSEPCKFDEK